MGHNGSLLKIENLVFSFGSVQALIDVSLEVEDEILALIGPNGAGKMSLLNCISGLLSGGEQQMLVIGRGLLSRPKIMLMDEPSLGFAPFLVKHIFEMIKRINTERNTAILLVEQNALAALEISSYSYVMENGHIVLDGLASKLKDNEDIKEFYIGLSNVGSRESYKDVKHYKRRKRWLS